MTRVFDDAVIEAVTDIIMDGIDTAHGNGNKIADYDISERIALAALSAAAAVLEGDLREQIAQAIEAAKTGDGHDDNVRASDARIARNTT